MLIKSVLPIKYDNIIMLNVIRSNVTIHFLVNLYVVRRYFSMLLNLRLKIWYKSTLKREHYKLVRSRYKYYECKHRHGVENNLILAQNIQLKNMKNKLPSNSTNNINYVAPQTVEPGKILFQLKYPLVLYQSLPCIR